MAKVIDAKKVMVRELSGTMLAKFMEILNSGDVEATTLYGKAYIITDVEPQYLTYPEGWYYDCGYLRTFRKESELVELYDKSGTPWRKKACYIVM